MYKTQPSTAIDQGVIVSGLWFAHDDETRLGLVLTPTCDFAQNKISYVQVCSLIPIDELIQWLLTNLWSKTRRSDVQTNIKLLLDQRMPRFHWFEPLPGKQIAMVADFQGIGSYGLEEMASLSPIAELDSPYREQVAARYSAYMGRVGTPDRDKTVFDHWLKIGMQATEGHDWPNNPN